MGAKINLETIRFNRSAVLRLAWQIFHRNNEPGCAGSPMTRTFGYALKTAWPHAKQAKHIARRGFRSDVENFLTFEFISAPIAAVEQRLAA